MPDRYGDTAEHCGLCDEHGNRDGFPCDHTDHQAAARRGMAMLRAAMGWPEPKEKR